MSRVRLYFDEDAMQQALVVALRARNVDVVTASECGMVARSDGDHLEYASREGRVLYSFNIKDYRVLHEQRIADGLEHSGIMLSFQQRYSVGEQLKLLLKFLGEMPAAEMRSRLEYLSNWAVNPSPDTQLS